MTGTEECGDCRYAIPVRSSTKPVVIGICRHAECRRYSPRRPESSDNLFQRTIKNTPENEREIRGVI